MKVDAIPQNPMEWVAVKANLLPKPLVHTQIMFVLSRAILLAFKFHIFDAVGEGSKSLAELAKDTGLNERALRSLTNVLISSGYFNYNGSKFSLTTMARKWCLKDQPNNVYHQQLFNHICWDWMGHMDEFMQTGKGLQYHETFNDNEWDLYQKGMENVATSTAKEMPKLLPKLNNPTRMLDIGGSHGIYSVEMCRKYPTLTATILDLPPAVEKAAPILAKYNMGERVKHQAGNALADDLGENEYDVVFLSSVIHHFTEDQCHLISKKVTRALKPGGYFVIQEFLRPEPAANMDMVGSVLDLFFNLSSTAGNWSLAEIKNFQETGGTKFYKVNKYLVPGYVQVISKKKL